MAFSDALLLELVGEVMAMLDLDEFRLGLIEALLRTVPSKFASLNEVVGATPVAALAVPHLSEAWFKRFAEHGHENPILQHNIRTLDGRPYRFSDLCTREELEATQLYQRFYAPLGIHNQIAFTLPSEAGSLVAVALSRGQKDYSDAERAFLERARPFLIQAYRNALLHSGRSGEPSPAKLNGTLEHHGLTRREAEVVGLVALGGSNRHVAERLGLSDRTVQKHLEHAYRKLDVHSRSEAAARAWELAGD